MYWGTDAQEAGKETVHVPAEDSEAEVCVSCTSPYPLHMVDRLDIFVVIERHGSLSSWPAGTNYKLQVVGRMNRV